MMNFSKNNYWDELSGVEKVIKLTAADTPTHLLKHLIDLLTIPMDSKNNFYSFDNILVLITIVYSMMGNSIDWDYKEEKQLKEKLISVLLERPMNKIPKYLSPIENILKEHYDHNNDNDRNDSHETNNNNEDDGEEEEEDDDDDDIIQETLLIRDFVDHLMKKLRKIMCKRKGLKEMSKMVVGKGTNAVQPVLSQLTGLVVSSNGGDSESHDVRPAQSSSLTGLLKSGWGAFGFTKQHEPSDDDVIIIVALGGLCWFEYSEVMNIAKKHGKKVIIGTTDILTRNKLMNRIFS